MPKSTASLKVSRHPDPAKPNHILFRPNISIPAEKESSAKNVIFLVDSNKNNDGAVLSGNRSIAYVNQLTTSLIEILTINKDSFSVVQFHSSATCPMPKQIYTSNKACTFYALGDATNIEAGFDGAFNRIDKQNLDNTIIVLLLAGSITEGNKDPKELISKLKQKLGGKAVRVLPIGIGNNYPLDFMRKLAEETGCHGFIHVEDNTDPKIVVEKVKDYLFSERKKITLDIMIRNNLLWFYDLNLNRSGSHFVASDAHEVDIKDLLQMRDISYSLRSQTIKIDCLVKVYAHVKGKFARIYSNYIFHNDKFEYEPEVVEKYYTEQYLRIVFDEITVNTATKLKELVESLNQLKLNHYKIIYDFNFTVEKTIKSLQNSSQSEFRNIISNVFNNYYKISSVGSSLISSESGSPNNGKSSLNGRDVSTTQPISIDSTAASSEPLDSNLSIATQVAFSGITREVSSLPALIVSPSLSSNVFSGEEDGSSDNESTNALFQFPNNRLALINDWFSVVSNIKNTYGQQCGLFKWRSNESLKLLKDIDNKDCYDRLHNEHKERYVKSYLKDFKNKGKRLFDILLEQKIKLNQARPDYRANSIWLTDEILYLIQNKYAKNRGFKLFGRTCEASANLLNYLNGSDTLMQKQQAIDDYLNDQDEQGELLNEGKRLFIILSEMKAKFALVANQDLSRRNGL